MSQSITEHDVRFEVTEHPEPDDPSSTHILRMYDLHTDQLLETHILGDPGGFIEAFREVQAFPDMQQRLNYYESLGIGN